MYCRHCGREIPADGRFCPGCGKPYLPPRSVPEPDDHRLAAGAATETGTAAAVETATAPPPEEPARPEPETPAPAPQPAEAETAPPPAPDNEEAAPPPMPAPAPLWEQGSPSLSPPPPRKKRRRVLIALLILVILAVLLLGAFGLLYFTGNLEAVLGTRQGARPLAEASEPESPVPQEVSEPPAAEPAAQAPEPEETPLTPVTRSGDSQPPFPHVSEAYLFAREDGEQIYFLPLDNEAGTPLYIYRMNRDGSDLAAVVTLESPDADTQPVVECFTLLGEYIYFGTRVSLNHCAYFRVPKAGGSTEFLFLQELSVMVPYEDSLYFLFPRQRAWGRYDPAQQQLPALHDLPDHGGSDEPEVQHQFSVVEGYLYYGEYEGAGASYYRLDLESGDEETLLAAEVLGQYVLRPIWVEETAYYVQFGADAGLDTWNRARSPGSEGERLFREESDDGRVLFAARLGDAFLYQDGERYLWAPVDNPHDSSVKVVSRWQPFAVTEGWIFFPDRLSPVDERAEDIPLAGIPAQPLDQNFAAAYEQAVALAGETPDTQPGAAPH